MYHGIHDISNVSNLLGGFMKKLIRCLFIVCILCFSISPVYARAGGGGGGSSGGGGGGSGSPSHHSSSPVRYVDTPERRIASLITFSFISYGFSCLEKISS